MQVIIHPSFKQVDNQIIKQELKYLPRVGDMLILSSEMISGKVTDVVHRLDEERIDIWLD